MIMHIFIGNVLIYEERTLTQAHLVRTYSICSWTEQPMGWGVLEMTGAMMSSKVCSDAFQTSALLLGGIVSTYGKQ